MARSGSPRLRSITDNDYDGDPDGLVQLAHLLLSRDVATSCVIGGQVAAFDPAWSADGPSRSVGEARRIAELCGRDDVDVVAGAVHPLTGGAHPQASEGAERIVAEAMRRDVSTPLVVACGGGLTNVASAWLLEPRIAARVLVVWIGGRAEGDPTDEYNWSIDDVAARTVLAESDLEVWQVPREAYTQVLASMSELELRMGRRGALGAHLFDRLTSAIERYESWGVGMGETYVLGDSPLVLLTALRSSFDRAPSSCRWEDRPRSGGRHPIRCFTQLDSRLVLEDLFAKLALHTPPA